MRMYSLCVLMDVCVCVCVVDLVPKCVFFVCLFD